MNYLHNNLTALARVNPQLANFLWRVPSAEWAEEVASNKLSVDIDSKTSVLIQDNEEELTKIKGLDFSNIFDICCFGFGNGSEIEKFFLSTGKQTGLFLFEFRPDFLVRVFQTKDFTAILSSPRVHLFVGTPWGRVFEVIQEFLVRLAVVEINEGVIHIHENQASFSLFPQYYRSLVNSFMEQLRIGVSHVKTVKLNSKLYTRQILKNLPVILGGHDILRLQNVWKGKPIICVAAGPSLDEDIPILKDLQDKALIICADTAYHILSKNGIHPAVVCSIDPHEGNKQLYENTKTSPKVCLVADARASNATVQKFDGPKITFSDGRMFLTKLLSCCGRPVLKFPASGSVAHLVFHLANYMGADPIFLSAYDMCYAKGKIYASGTMYEDLSKDWAKIQNEQINKEKKEGNIHEIPNTSKEMVITNSTLLSYLRNLEELISGSSALVVDLSKGAMKRGTVIKKWEQVISVFSDSSFKSIFTSLKAEDISLVLKIEELSTFLLSFAETLETVCGHYRTMEEITKRGSLVCEQEDKSELPGLKKQMEELMPKLDSLATQEFLAMWREYDQEATVKVMFDDLNVAHKTELSSVMDTMALRFNRDITYYSGMATSGEELRELLLKTVEELKCL